MKSRTIIMNLAAVLAAVSCAEIEPATPEVQPETKSIIYANVVETKTSLDAASGTVTWKENDAIKVSVRNAAGALVEFKNTDKTASKTATFESLDFLPAHENLVAIYPASAYQSESAAGSRITIPAEQYGVAANFPVDANGAVIFPAFAYCEGENQEGQIVMNFKHIGGLFGVEIPDYLENIVKVELETTGAALAGDFNLAVADAKSASLTSVAPVSKITLLPAAGAKVFTAGKYYVAMAPGKYTGIKITLTTAVGGTFVRTSETFAYEITKNGRVRFNLANIIANAKVGDCFLADGTWADASKEVEGKVDGKEVIGYVLYTGSDFLSQEVMKHTNGKIMYSLETDLQQRPGHYFHGYVLSKKINNNQFHNEKWIGNICNSKGNNQLGKELEAYTYLCYMYKGFSGGYTGTTQNFDLCFGYVNSKWFFADWYKKNWSIMASMTAAPLNTSGWYVPSVGDIRNIILTNVEKIKSSMTLSGNFWTSSTSHLNLDYDYPICFDFNNQVYNYQPRCQDKLNVVYMLAF